MKQTIITLLLVSAFTFSSCTAQNAHDKSTNTASQKDLSHLQTAYFASGCFWCVEAVFESVEGVEEAISGYAGGHTDNPTYQSIGTGTTGHAESVQVFYDSTIVSFETLVNVYYGSHDPTTINGQHPDFGTQYRSILFYQNAREKEIAENFKKALDASGEYSQPIATEITRLKTFYPAEDYHQNYEKLHPENPYVQKVSIPRLRKFQSKFPGILKDDLQ
jgi:peptide-methionine (S)-S-oxide reductase